MTSQRDKFLDGWRGVSVLFVVQLHYIFYFWQQEFVSLRYVALNGSWVELAYQMALRPMFAAGSIGVPIFFLISGYIITLLLIKEENKNYNISIYSFYVRRFFRIFPILIIYLISLYVLNKFDYLDIDKNSYYASSLFLCNVYQCDWWHAHLWSLAVEEQFYLVWPILFVLFPLHRISVIVALCVLFFVLSIEYHTFSAFLYIGIGALFATAEQMRRAPNLPTAIPWTCLTILVLQSYIPGTSAVIAILTPIKPFIVAGLFFGSFRSPSFHRFIELPILVAVGRVSYGVYLWQQLFTAPESRYLAQVSGWAILLLPVVVLPMYYLVELPFISKGRKISKEIQELKRKGAV